MNRDHASKDQLEERRHEGRAKESLALIMDIGWTHIKATITDEVKGNVLGYSSYPATLHDPSLCLEEVLSNLPDYTSNNLAMVYISIPFMTDAVMKGIGGRVCVMLIGYPRYLTVNTLGQQFVYLAGGHNVAGDEVNPLDENSLREAARTYCAVVDAFAVSSYFSVRNPEHEIIARRIIEGETSKPIICGHELSMQLDATKRAYMTISNAQLIPFIGNLLTSIEYVLSGHNIKAPLMLSYGDDNFITIDNHVKKNVSDLNRVLNMESDTKGLRLAAWMMGCMGANQMEEEVIIRQKLDGTYHVYASDGRYRYLNVEKATIVARQKAAELAVEKARQAGAGGGELEEKQSEFTIKGSEGQLVVLERRLSARVFG